MRNPLVRSRRRTLTVLTVVAACMLLAGVLAWVAFARAVTGTPAGAQVNAQQTQQSCGDAAGRWMVTYVDQGMPAEEWAAELASRTAPEAVQALAGVDRSRVPTGGVRTVEVAADGVSCDARVRTGDGAVTALTLATADGAWLVTSWGSPSQESG